MRALRELEPPSPDEGFDRVETLSFARVATSDRSRAGVFVAAPAMLRPGWQTAVGEGAPGAPHLLFDWRPGGSPDDLDSAVTQLSASVTGVVAAAVCTHGGGPPSCWCRPPLPGLPLAFARSQGVDPSRSVLIGTAAAHRTLATALGARYVPVG
jgi:hypothetical protein